MSVKTKVLEQLENNPGGMTLHTLVIKLNESYYIISNAVSELKGQGLIEVKEIGTAKFCELKEVIKNE